MNKLMLAVVMVLAVFIGAKAEEAAVATNMTAKARAAAVWAKKCDMTVEAWNALSKEEQKAKMDAAKAKRMTEIMERQAKRCGMTAEEWKKLTPAEQKEKLTASRQVSKDRRENVWAQRCGVSIDEWKKLSDADKKAKMGEWKAAQKKAKSALTKPAE